MVIDHGGCAVRGAAAPMTSSSPGTAIGIDLGTTFSVVAQVTDAGVPFRITLMVLRGPDSDHQHEAHISPILCQIWVRFGHKKQKKHSQLIVVSAYAVTSAGNRT